MRRLLRIGYQHDICVALSILQQHAAAVLFDPRGFVESIYVRMFMKADSVSTKADTVEAS